MAAKPFWATLRAAKPAAAHAPVSYGQIKEFLSSTDPASAYAMVDSTRGSGMPVHPALQGLSPEQLAQMDRAAQFADLGSRTPTPLRPFMAVPALAAAGGYEALKTSPLLMRALSKVPGLGDFAPEGMSPPSLSNVTAAAKGYTEGAFPGLLDVLGRYRPGGSPTSGGSD